MQIISINATHGPNYWSIHHHHLIIMTLDIEELENQPTDEILGFHKRLKKTLPGLFEHRCSPGVRGGFLKRVQRGTWMGHVVEHLAIELQILAGMPAGFGRARGTGTPGCYNIIFDYTDEAVGFAVAHMAVQIAEDLIKGGSRNIKKYIAELRQIRLLNTPGPSTAALLAEAQKRGIPFIFIPETDTYQLGYGNAQKKIRATIASTTTNMAVDLACHKEECKNLLKSMFIPVAEGELISSREELKTAVQRLGFPLVVKPISGNHGRGVTIGINSVKDACKAFELAASISPQVIIERYVIGDDYRLLIINYKLVAAAQRTPAHITGDGISSVRELIEQVNRHPQRGHGHQKVLTKIPIDKCLKSNIRSKGFKLTSVLKQNEILYLHHTANLSTGGTAEDVTDKVHPNIKSMAERLSRILDLNICGIDLMTSRIDKPLQLTAGVVLEVNAAPGFRMHLSPSKGPARNVASPVIDMLFPHGTAHRIPIIAISGTNGKTTTTRLIAHIMKIAGKKVGYSTTDGIYIDNHLIMKGDCTGPKSANFVLRDPTVDMAVLECARGGIIRSGLGFDYCDVGVVTNVASDHLGIQGIDTLEKMARLKAVIPESVDENGHAILNADDALVYAMKKNLRCKTILFSMDANNPLVDKHLTEGGTCVVYKEGFITILDGENSYELELVQNIPLTFGGKAGFMIENVLAAVSAAYAQQISLNTMRLALATFIPSPEQTPGRMNIFHFGYFDIMIDYAHNPAGLIALKKYLEQTPYVQKVGIVAAIGDRRNEDSIELGSIAGEVFDEIIIREDSDLRGKKPGELGELIRAGVLLSAPNKKITNITKEIDALHYAIENALPGTLVVLCTENVTEVLAFAKKEMARKINQYKLEKNRIPGRNIPAIKPGGIQ